MNEQLQIELTKIITNINTGGESAWGFITAQTPDVVQQLLFWHGMHSFVWFIIIAILIVVSFFGCRKLFKISLPLIEEEKRKNYPDYIVYVAMWIIPTILTFVTIFMNLVHNLDWLKIWIAPKVWLLEYVASMVKQ